MKKNPLNKSEIEKQAFEPKRIEPELETDDFGDEEQKKIVTMVLEDAKSGMEVLAQWKINKEKDIQHLNSEKPSIIEGLQKQPWMSDRNLGLCAGVLDIYQATLQATCWNPTSIHFKASEMNDVDNRDNAEKFMKWVVSQAESNLDPEIDDHINHRVSLGFSLFKIYWDVWYEWVDKRVPIPAKDGSKRIVGYEIKTEKVRFEKGRMVNVDHLDDILLPSYGKRIQDLKYMIEILHITANDLEELYDRGVITNYVNGKFVSTQPDQENKLRTIDERSLGTSTNISQSHESDKRNLPIDIYEWYGTYRKNGKTEKYRFWIEPKTGTFLSGKPLRKINRLGKYPYVGGALRRRPGFIKGGSLTTLIAPAINALNNNFNQTSDFQFFENCPFGFYDKNQEGLSGGVQDIEPMKLYPVDGDPNKLMMFPNLSRSLAWSYQYNEFLLQMIERLTGAASYFLTSNEPGATATRDNIVEEKGNVKFGLWVKRIQQDIAEGLNMLFYMYQDWAPQDLGKRVLGDDGKEIIKNLSINTLRGNMDCYITPDITSGSKAYERQTSMFAVQAASQGCMWLDPRLNPRGNWLLWKDAFIKQGIQNPEHFMPPQPKEQMDYSKEAEAHFNQLLQGDRPEPPSNDNPQIVECLATFSRLKDTRYHELDEEYKPNFDDYFFKVVVNYQGFMKRLAQEHMAMQIAASATQKLQASGVQPGMQQPVAQPQIPQPGMAPPAKQGMQPEFGVGE